MNKEHFCPVCSNPTSFLGSQTGRLDSREFLIRHCGLCHFSYVENHRTDFENIYNEDYYRGVGADPMVDYMYELQNTSKTIRNYEWQGIYSIYKELCPSGGRWLDYGCGGGGLVKFAIERGIDAIGFEENLVLDMGAFSTTPILRKSEIEVYAGSFDFISAIEVLEHISRPVDTLLRIRKLLKPGGILFLTTGNAQPWRQNLLSWGYTKCPDVHISFYEPETLARCMRAAGFCPKKFTCLGMFKKR